jgi:transposase InsO family protein
MVVSSDLSKNRYSPLHGTFWNTVLNGRNRNRNPIGCDNELPAFATSTSKLQQQDFCEQPDPRWSVRKVGDWLQRQVRDADDLAIHSLRLCIECVVPVPLLSANADGLYPIFATDAFGIKGTSGLTQWIVDSGATSHCTSDISTFTTLSRDVPFNQIRVANGKSVKVAGVGDVLLHLVDSKDPERNIKLILKNVLYIPDIPVNLISTRALWNDGGIKSTFAGNCTLTFKNGGAVSFDTGKYGHYYCVAKTSTSNADPATPLNFGESLCAVCEPADAANAAAVLSTHPPTSDVVHARLGHCGPERAVEALRRSTGLPELPHYRKDLPAHCDGCRTGGARKTPLHGIPVPFRPKAFGDRIHSDLCGPFPTSITGKFEYILCFVDNFTGYSEIFFLQSKSSSEVKPHFERFVKKWKSKLPDGVVREWFTDNGGEFFSSDISDFCDEFVTKRGFTVPYRSPQNAQAERLWGILQRCMRIMLAHSGLPVTFWHYAAKQANELHNLLPRHSNLDHRSPHEMVYDTKPDFSFVRVWGCLAYCTILNEQDRATRVSPTAVKAVQLGRDDRRRDHG